MAQTIYAELVDLSDVPALETGLGEAGTFSAKVVKGRRYWYFQPARSVAVTGQRYVGSETDELLQRIAKHWEAKREQSAQRAMVRSLVHAYGLPAPLRAVGQVVQGLAHSGMFRRGVLVGVAAYQTYAAMLGVRLRGALVKKSDVNAAQFLSVSITVVDDADSAEKILLAIDKSFRKIPGPRDSESTQYISSQLVRVDFSIPYRAADSDDPLYMQAPATDTMRSLDFLIQEPVRAVLLHGSGAGVTVPSPERFAVHQLIQSCRGKSSQTTVNKELQRAASLLTVLLQKRPDDLKRVSDEAMHRGPKWREQLLEGIGQLPVSIQEGLRASGINSV